METAAIVCRSLPAQDRVKSSAMRGTYIRQDNGFRQQIVLLDKISENLDQYFSLPTIGYKE